MIHRAVFRALRPYVWLNGGRKRALAGVMLAAAVLGPMAAADPKPGSADLVVADIEIKATPIANFARGIAGGSRFGALEFRGGLTLSSGDRHFGGWSGIEIGNAGRRIALVSDHGAWLTGELEYDGRRLKGLAKASMGPVLALGGRHLTRERDRDAEGLRLLSGTLDKGMVLVSFEQNHRVGVFPVTRQGLGAPTRYLNRSGDWRRISGNRGLEAVTVVQGGPRKGAIIGLAERRLDRAGHHSGWLWTGLGAQPTAIAVHRYGTFDITDAVSLSDGALVVLERSFNWSEGVKMRLRLIPAQAVQPGALMDGPVLLEAGMSYDIDNMEGLAVHEANGETILTLVSDDNFNRFLQRTIILQFALYRDRVTAAAR